MPRLGQDGKKFLEDARRYLRARIDIAYREDSRRFFKEPVKILGVRTPEIRRFIARERSRIRAFQKEELFSLSESLLASGWNEEATVAFGLLASSAQKLEPKDFLRLEKLLKSFVTNWGMCDDFCSHVIGPFLVRFPQKRSRIRAWVRSKNPWPRRAAAVSLVVPLRKGLFLPDAFFIATRLLKDKEDLVQKGCGWMLKEASRTHDDEVLAYLRRHRSDMPRMVLRYALELYPKEVRQSF